MLTGVIKITQSRKNTEIRIRRTTSENWETLTTTRVPWITKLNSTKTPPTLRRGGLLIRLHLLQLVGLLEYFILDSIAEHGSQQIPQALLWQALGMLHDFIKYTLVLSCLLVIINLGDRNKSLQVKDSILRIKTRLFCRPVKSLDSQWYRSGIRLIVTPQLLSLSSKAFQLNGSWF